jgi:2-polyprenyl-3-methyl-5-hydroxy-6-metoxy-1,4-benzoquinol methylase
MFEKKETYFGNIRLDIVNLVENGGNKILEIGCGAGNTGKMLKQQGKASEVVGIEKVPEIAEIAKTVLDKVVCGDVETAELPLSKEYFDYVIASEVLEHLYDPWSLVDKLRIYLRKGGYIIASLPNIRNWRIVKGLVLKGEWEYSHDGALDNTHLRFFTKKSMTRLFQSKGFVVISIVPKFKYDIGNRYNILNRFTLGLLEDFITTNYVIKAKNV